MQASDSATGRQMPAGEVSKSGNGGLGTAGWYSVASLGAGFFYAFNNFTLPLVLGAMTSNATLIGLLSSTRSIEGVVIQPTIGAWSDRVWTPLGRRRIFMAVGLPISAFFFVVAAQVHTLPLLVAAIVLFSLLFNAAIDPYNALLADLFPPERRSVVNSLATVVQFVGQVAMLLLAAQLSGTTVPPLVFYVVAGGMLVTAAITIIRIREPRHLASPAAELDERTAVSFREYVQRLTGNRMALRYLVCLFFFNFGVNAILPFLTLFAERVIHTDARVAQQLSVPLLVSAGLFVLPAGLLAARIGRKPVLAGGILLLAVTALGGLVIQTVPQTVLIVILAGVANAAISATNWPLLTELIPADEVGVFAGIKTAFESVAIPASAIVAGALIGHWGYRAIFGVLTFGAVLAVLVLATVVVPGGEAGSE
ncbi:MAG TPA: MFS transporter [Chloroflexota bacterium]